LVRGDNSIDSTTSRIMSFTDVIANYWARLKEDSNAKDGFARPFFDKLLHNLNSRIEALESGAEALPRPEPVSVDHATNEDLPAIIARLRELSKAVTTGREAVAREFTMRVPAEPLRDADLVLSTAADELERARRALQLAQERALLAQFIKVVFVEAGSAANMCALVKPEPKPQPEPPTPALAEQLAYLIANFASTARVGEDAMPTAREVLAKVADWLEKKNPGNGWLYADKLRAEANR
jgi:hypothetical protein